MTHLFSLLHALSCQYLRDDLELDNLQPLRAMAPAAPASGSQPGAQSSPPSSHRAATGEGDVWGDVPHAGVERAGTVRVMHAQQPSQATMQSQQRGLHTVPFISAFVERWGPSANRSFNAAVPLSVIGGVSAEERVALAATHARVRVVQTWLIRAMAQRMHGEEGMTVGSRKWPPTPIISRTYQVCMSFCVGRGRRCAGGACRAARARLTRSQTAHVGGHARVRAGAQDRGDTVSASACTPGGSISHCIRLADAHHVRRLVLRAVGRHHS